jgi:hypothetical protein
MRIVDVKIAPRQEHPSPLQRSLARYNSRRSSILVVFHPGVLEQILHQSKRNTGTA